MTKVSLRRKKLKIGRTKEWKGIPEMDWGRRSVHFGKERL
jgi:hypothetical protein